MFKEKEEIMTRVGGGSVRIRERRTESGMGEKRKRTP